MFGHRTGPVQPPNSERNHSQHPIGIVIGIVFFHVVSAGWQHNLVTASQCFSGDVSLICLKMMAALLSLEAPTKIVRTWMFCLGFSIEPHP
jgi:hypothetical protein